MKKLILIILFTAAGHAFAQKAKSMRLEYNQTNVPKTIALSGFYMDINKNYYSTQVTIDPHKSIILFELDQPPLALQFKSFDLSTGTNTTTLKFVVFDDITGSEKQIIIKYQYR